MANLNQIENGELRMENNSTNSGFFCKNSSYLCKNSQFSILNSQLKFPLLILILLIAVQGFAQELPNADILVNGEILPGFYKAGIRYGKEKEDSLYIKWARSVDADTFWVYKAGLRLEYITNANMRTAWYNHPTRYERRMALHHLRERIFDTPLRFNNLENLSKNNRTMFSGKNLYEYFTR
ncbi:MAG: hypothetical protein LBU89_08245 [Fibromonadaceae bacterium]|jgi:hypothetical protein|nr:hypothetical protein [Fibromonadaceae bacterium]